jgi:hypothetical protein
MTNPLNIVDISKRVSHSYQYPLKRSMPDEQSPLSIV